MAEQRQRIRPTAEQAAMAAATGVGDVRYLAVQQEMSGFRQEARSAGEVVGKHVRNQRAKAARPMAMAERPKAAAGPKRKSAVPISPAIRRKANLAVAKKRAAVADTVRGVRASDSALVKINRAASVANPFMLTASGMVAASGAYNAMRAAGGSRTQAAGAAVTAATPAAATIAAPALIGRAAPKMAALLSRAALPLTLATAAIGAARGGYNAYKHGDNALSVAGSAMLGAADALTFGLATRGIEAVTGVSHGTDAKTLALAKAGGQIDPQGNKIATPALPAPNPKRAGQTASGPQRLTASQARSFDRAEKASGPKPAAKTPPAPQRPSGRVAGFSPEARIAAYYKRNPGGQNAPYGGDPASAPDYIAPEKEISP